MRSLYSCILGVLGTNYLRVKKRGRSDETGLPAGQAVRSECADMAKGECRGENGDSGRPVTRTCP